MALLDPRIVYAPFEYEQAYKYWELQQQAHWLASEVSMSADVLDWNTKLTDADKYTIGHTLKGFTQTEIFIADYWSNKVYRWFKKPEIQMMSAAFSSTESIHAVAYALLNQTLGLEDFSAFYQEPATKAKIDRLIETRGNTKEDIAKSLAIFSAFNEGVNLFSSFAILLSYKRFGLLVGVGTIIAWSVRDESTHSEAGCWLFNQLIQEYPEIWTDSLKKDIYDAARLTIQLEDEYIDKAFSAGPIKDLDPKDLKQFIRHRANTKLQDLGLKSNWKNVDKTSVNKITSWFEPLVYGVEQTDFFFARPTAYSKGTKDFSKIWD